MTVRKLRARPAQHKERDTSIGIGVSQGGRAILSKHASARYVFVNPSTGSDAYDGLSATYTGGISGPKATPGEGYKALRPNFGDWLLLPAGATFAMGFSPSGTSVYGKPGVNARYPTLVTTYDTSAPNDESLYRLGRVTVGTDGLSSSVFTGTDNAGAGRYYILNQAFENLDFTKSAISSAVTLWIGFGDGLLIENCRFTMNQVTVQGDSSADDTLKNIIVRRSSFTRGVLPGAAHGQGFYAEFVDGLTIEDSVFHHNGWIGAARDDSVASGGAPDIYKHNCYINTRSKNVRVRRCVSGHAASHGFQLRGGADVSDLVCVKNPINILAGAGDSYDVYQPDGVLFTGRRITISGSNDISSALARGFGLDFGNTVAQSYIEDSIISHVSAGATGNLYSTTGQAAFAQPSLMRQTGNIIHDWGGNAFAATGANSGQVQITRLNNQWTTEAASGTNTVFSPGAVPDSTRTAETYAASLGYANSDAMLDAACLTPDRDWALEIGAYIRGGYGR